MIEDIRIKDIGVIDDATIELSRGLNVLTGETGAGKTMILTALNMVLGGKVDSSRVRVGAAKASAEAVIDITSTSAAAQALVDAGAAEEDEDPAEAIMTRTVSDAGRSRAILSGRTVPASVLAGLGADLVAVHGQSDQIRLTSASQQRKALDRFGGIELAETKARYKELYRAWEEAEAAYQEISTRQRERKLEASQLRDAIDEIDALQLQPNEDEDLKAESLRLENLEGLRGAGALASEALAGSESVEAMSAVQALETAVRALEGESESAFQELSGRIRSCIAELNDVAVEVASFVTGLDEQSPARLDEIQNRRAEISQLTRKYAPSASEVLAWADERRPRLAELEGDDESLEHLEQERARLQAETTACAAELTRLRSDASADFARRATAELAALAMPTAELTVTVEPAEKLGPSGADVVSILLASHPGAPAQPLGKGASGGELSRIMLAIEVVLAFVDPVPTMVFDEVDAGVGGKAAIEIGRRLAMLATNVQVIVVTHLPQVASFADRHIRILKGVSEGVTASDVSALDEKERIQELARMLAGHERSDSAQEHASELVADALEYKKGLGERMKTAPNRR